MNEFSEPIDAFLTYLRACEQRYHMRNCGKTKAVQAFEDLWISWVRSGARRDDRGRPVLPEKGQEARSA